MYARTNTEKLRAVVAFFDGVLLLEHVEEKDRWCVRLLDMLLPFRGTLSSIVEDTLRGRTLSNGVHIVPDEFDLLCLACSPGRVRFRRKIRNSDERQLLSIYRGLVRDSVRTSVNREAKRSVMPRDVPAFACCDPVAISIANEKRQLLLEAIQSMDETKRHVAEMTWLEGKNPSEIAALDPTLNTSQIYYRRSVSRQQLRKILAES